MLTNILRDNNVVNVEVQIGKLPRWYGHNFDNTLEEVIRGELEGVFKKEDIVINYTSDSKSEEALYGDAPYLYAWDADGNVIIDGLRLNVKYIMSTVEYIIGGCCPYCPMNDNLENGCCSTCGREAWDYEF